MHPVARIVPIILICNGLILTLPMNNVVSGGVLPDFDLEIDNSIIWVNPETGIGQGTITITNVAITASIRVRLVLEVTPGMQVAPQLLTVTVNPGSSVTIPIAIGTTLDSPARIASVSAWAEITHVNGAPVSGVKDRSTSVAVIVPRSHTLYPIDLNITVMQGETKKDMVTLDNMINSEDFIALEFLNTDDQVQAIHR